MARQPKPLSLHIDQGTYRADRHGSLDSVVSPAGVPTRPRSLKGEARKFWDRVVPGLVSSGVARACDTDTLTALCQWWARYVRYSEALDTAECEPGSTEFGRIMTAASTSWEKFEKLAGRFGLTPADRMHLRVEQGQTKGGIATRDRTQPPRFAQGE